MIVVESSGAVAQLTAIVGLGLALLSGVQIVFGFRRERRETRQAQARMGYELIDSLFDDAEAGPLLTALDSGFEDRGTRSRRTREAVEIAAAFDLAFGSGIDMVTDELTAVRIKFDAVLYYLDRFEHAIVAELTTFDDVRASWQYYSDLLGRYARAIDGYAVDTGYPRAKAFLQRYPEWVNAAKAVVGR